jgi:hypothetical protein
MLLRLSEQHYTECGLPDNMLLNKASPADLSCQLRSDAVIVSINLSVQIHKETMRLKQA